MRDINVYRIPLGSYDCNCYLVHNIINNNTIVIDCGDGEGLVNYIEKNNLNLNMKYGLLTHGHFDHTNGVEYMQQHFGTTFFMALPDMQAQHEEPYLFTKLNHINPIYDNSVLNFDGVIVNVISTPGHTLGSVTYRIGDLIFTGDTLFKGTIGRTDLYGGDFDIIIESIRYKLFNLPDSTIIYPGHGEESTIKEEKISNKFLKHILGGENLNG
ncbi:MBL fold metallo-hydrolase [Candidatus Arthromitus sp. SFB-rat-Yit]|uniref:MBL fold metallo-hydrolase n=1 Tax=Candidatus Arthromitus sp. SFB-rat-Yit TaxID=1041504 RepID=UPI000227A160|nr:MBL fold metallo-hydrolase [Candidatus Arthromitus sp. SFB-rat-Yit]BAK81278.1 beta-lactamase domain protein [Candidatus Arthromitus sp. SFB-rat-Yit]